MASPATIPMFDPHGQLGDVPAERIWDTVQAGGKIAIPAIAPDGSPGYLPHDQLARAKGARVDVNNPETQSIFDAMKDANPPHQSAGFWKSAGSDLKALFTSAPSVASPYPGMDLDKKQELFQQAQQADQQRQQEGHGLPYRVGAATVSPIANVSGMEQSAREGDAMGVLGHAAAGATMAAAPLITEGAIRTGKAISGGTGAVAAMVEKPAYFMSADELASTTPKRIAELKSVPDKVSAVQKLAVDTEARAKAAAKAAYPDVETPITRTHVLEVGDENPLSPGAEETPIPSRRVVTQEKIPFSQVQEEYARVGKQIADEKRAVARGAAPAYDLAKLTEKYNSLASEMRDAAAKDGKLDAFLSAQKQWKQYMDDFHNSSSPVRPLLETTPDQTAKIANHLLNADKGARALEVLERNGADVSGARGLLSKGSTPLKVDVAESAKLRKAGDETAYTQQRYQEALDQATTNRLPAGAEAKVPAKAMSGRSPLAVPGTKIGLPAPRTVTRYKLRQALSGK